MGRQDFDTVGSGSLHSPTGPLPVFVVPLNTQRGAGRDGVEAIGTPPANETGLTP